MQGFSFIVDIIILALVVLVVCLGVKRGFVKSSVGLVSTILVILVAVFATSPLTTLITASTTWDDQLADAIDTPLSSKLPNAYSKVYFTAAGADEEGEMQYALVYNVEGGEEKDFMTIMDSSPVAKGLGLAKLVKPYAEKMLTNQAAQEEIELDDYNNKIDFIDTITYPIATIVFTVAVFIALLIVARILIWILIKILKKVVSRFYIAHFLDKMLGGIFGLAMGALIVLIILTIIQIVSPLSFMTPVNDFLAKTVVTKFLMDNNFLYTLVSKYINIVDIMSKIGI